MSTFGPLAPVAQGIERRPPEAEAQVRILPGALFRHSAPLPRMKTATRAGTYRGVILEKDPSLGILGTGHNSVLQVPGTDDWYVVYHRFAIPDGAGHMRETTIDRLTFDEDGFMEQVIPTLESVDPQFIDPDQSPDPEPGPGDGSEVPGDGSEDPGDGSEDPGDNGDGSDGSTGDGDGSSADAGDGSSAAPPIDGSDGDSNAGKQLPRTGADNIALIAMALGLLAAGGAAVWARGRQRAGELLK